MRKMVNNDSEGEAGGVVKGVRMKVVVVRQVQLMIEALNGNLDLPLKLIAWVHLGIAVVMINKLFS